MPNLSETVVLDGGHSGKRWNNEEINFLRQNYKGMTYRKIGIFLGRSANGVKIKASRRLHLKKPSSGNYLKIYKLPKNAKELTPELGYVVGAALGDGHIFCRNNKNHRSGGITLKVVDKDFAELFSQKIKKWCGKEPRWYFGNGGEVIILGRTCVVKPTYIVMLNSMEVGKFLKERLEKLDWIRNTNNEEFKIMVLKGLWDSEGCVDKEGYCISFGNSKIKIMELFKGLCSDLDIRTGKIIKRATGLYFIKISNIANVVKFYERIGITIRRKRDLIGEKIENHIKRRSAYYFALKLKGRGFKINEIIKSLSSYNINKGTIAGWVYNRAKPRVIE